jgi:hypothetical protein
LPTALRQVAALSLVAVGAWAAIVGLLASWRPTARLARALTPRVLRAALFTTVSGTLAITPAHAAGELDGLPFPDRGTTIAPTPVTTGGHHVVKPGESLWTIAADALPPEATAAHVASASTAWYDANREAIGPDPDLILPGQQLTAPDAEVAR